MDRHSQSVTHHFPAAANVLVTPPNRAALSFDPHAGIVRDANSHAALGTGYRRGELIGMSGRRLFGDEGMTLLKTLFRHMSLADSGILWGKPVKIISPDKTGHERFCTFRSRRESPPGSCALPLLPIPPEHDRIEIILWPHAGSGAIGGELVAEAIRDDLWEMNLEKRLLFYGKAMQDILGHDGLAGGPGLRTDDWLASTYPGESTGLLHGWRESLAKGLRSRLRYRMRDISGNGRLIAADINTVLMDRKGTPVRLFGTHRDLTHEIREYGDFLDMENRLRLIFQNAGMGIALANAAGELERVNPALALMFGRNVEDIEGKRLAAFLPEDEQEALAAAFHRLAGGMRGQSLQENRILRPDNRTMWVKMTLTSSGEESNGKRPIMVLLEDITASHQSRERLIYETTHDSLTGLWNRSVLLGRLEEHIALAQRQGHPLTFCMADIDHFKMVNDRHGHQTGDVVLRRFADLLAVSMRETDFAGRYGGEEFGIIFPGTTLAGAEEAMCRFLDRLRVYEFMSPAYGMFHVTATLGIAALAEGDTAGSLIARADAALYKGKRHGRNQVIVQENETRAGLDKEKFAVS